MKRDQTRRSRTMINGQTLKMISMVESFLYSDKQGILEEGRRILWPKRCVLTYHNKDEDNSPKNNNQKVLFKCVHDWWIEFNGISTCLGFHFFFQGVRKSSTLCIFINIYIFVMLLLQSFCPVGWGWRIHWLHLCSGVRPSWMSVLDMTLNNLMGKFQ